MYSTKRARTYVEVLRARITRDRSTWFDVADAFDAGMRFALSSRQAARLALKELDDFRALDRSARGGER